MDDLFDFSGGADSVVAGAKHKRRDRESKNKSAAKSQANLAPANPTEDVSMEEGDVRGSSSEGDEDDEMDGDGAGPSSRRPRKRARKFNPAPVVMDELEIQANRELPVNAGLNAVPEADAGERLTLTHNVCQRFKYRQFWSHRAKHAPRSRRFDIKWLFRLDTTTRL